MTRGLKRTRIELKTKIELSLNEIDVILYATQPRNGQQLGQFYDAAKKKLLAARKELLEEFSKQGNLYEKP